jgi:hypothetical protein
MSEESNEDFGREYEANSLRAHLSAYVLVAGLVLELVNAVIWFKGPETIAEMVAVLLIVGGVWGEVFFGHKARIAGDKQLSKYEAQTAEANARALEAQAELARLKTPRMLSPEQRARISEKLRQFAGQQYAGSIAPGVADSWPLWNQIVGALRDANWVLIPPTGLAGGEPPAGIPTMTRSGVRIFCWAVTWMSSPSIKANAEALAAALIEEGIDALAWPAHGSTVESSPNVIRIEIGPKPA